jgi:nucleotide-binding universal stress UspA family protein
MNPAYTFPPRTILVPTDLGPASKAALQYARFFHKNFGSAVAVLHAHHFELPPYFSSGQMGELKRELKKLAQAAEEYVRKESERILGFSPRIQVVENRPIEAILESSQGKDIDLIIMGMHGHHGAERLLMGSVTERVLRRSALPVLAVHSAPSESPIRHILCPINPSETGKQALEYAAEISKAVGGHITVLHVVEPGDEPLTCPLVEDQIRNTCRIEEVRLHGNAARTIVDASNKLKSDLMIMGADHKPGVLGEFFSSTTSSVMQLAPGPLMVVPRRSSKD